MTLPYPQTKNVAFFGGTRQGKTVGANQDHATERAISVFFAPDPEPWMVGANISDPADFIKGLRAGRKKFVIKSDLWADETEWHRRWVAGLLDLCDRYPDLAVTMVHDEAQDLSQPALEKALKRGLKRGFRNVLTTQSPASRDVSLEPLRQADYYVWVGPIGSFDLEYVRDKGLFAAPAELLEAADHQYTCVTRSGQIVGTGYFDNRRYGDG